MKEFPRKIFEDFKSEFSILKKLKTPVDIQDFLISVPINFEKKSETYHSPLMMFRNNEAHCMEGAVFAAAALWYQGRPPLLFDLKTNNDDMDHVVALFKEGDRWGAISKTNHIVLRYRDAIYKSPRELAMSYFHEYFLDNGVKTLRSYSDPFDLRAFDDEWLIAEKPLWNIVKALDNSPHTNILERGAERRLRPAEPAEIEAGKITEWKR